MTFIAADGGRTVTNCTVHDARKVYEITTDALLEVCRSVPGTGEVERTGKQVTEQRGIMAQTPQAFARSAVHLKGVDYARATNDSFYRLNRMDLAR